MINVDNIEEHDFLVADNNNVSEHIKRNLDVEQKETDMDDNNVINDIDDNKNSKESSNEINQQLPTESIDKDNEFELYNNGVIDENINDDSNNNIDESIDINHQNNHKKMKLNIKNIKKPFTKWILFSNEYRSTLSKETKGMSIGDSAKIIAEKYKNISIEENERLELLVRQDKERYNNEIASNYYINHYITKYYIILISKYIVYVNII